MNESAEAVGIKPDLAQQAKNLPHVLGKFDDRKHELGDIKVEEDGTLHYQGKKFDVATIDAQLAEKRAAFLKVNQRVGAKAREVCPELTTTFAPFNGGETVGLSSPYTLATDRLPIGTPRQIGVLYENQIARAMYLLDKLHGGHSYTGVTQELGYVGAMLQWDIEGIQGGTIQQVVYLGADGTAQTDTEQEPAGIKITYTTSDNQTRVHEQYSCDSETVPSMIQAKLEARTIDALYFRGTHGFLRNPSPAHHTYLDTLRSGGVLVSESKPEDIVTFMGDVLTPVAQVVLESGERFGYAFAGGKVNFFKKEK